jgi:Tfp pilus assembly protein PilN
MIRINLLPYREALRAKKKRQAVVVLVSILLIAAMVYYAISLMFSARIQRERMQVQTLQAVSHRLKVKMGSVVDLRKKRAALIAREGLIARLQDQRNQATQVFNTLVKLTPKGVFLTELRSSHSLISVQGYAEGDAQVAEFMRHIQKSSVFSHPVLSVISRFKLKSDNSMPATVDRFTLYMHWRRHNPMDKNRKIEP